MSMQINAILQHNMSKETLEGSQKGVSTSYQRMKCERQMEKEKWLKENIFKE